jgi:general secretion pathway protein K
MKRRRGSVIIVVLVLITLASLLLARFMEDNSLELSMATMEADRRRLRADAQSEMELALAVIAEIRTIDINKIHAPSQGFEDPHAYAGFPPRDGLEVTFEYEDESAKLPLAILDKNTLTKFFYALNLEETDAEKVADALVGWMSKTYESIEEDATDAAYQRATLSYRPARRALRSFEELRSVGVCKDFFFDEKGESTPLLEAFKSCVSLYTFGDTNINTASDTLLLCIGLDDTQLGLIRDRQANMQKRIIGTPPYFRVTDEVRQLIGGGAPLQNFDDEVHLMWVRVTVKEGLAKCRVSALVAIRSDVSFTAAVVNPDTNPTINLGGQTSSARTASFTLSTGTSASSAGSTTGSSTANKTPSNSASTTSTTNPTAPTTTPGVDPPINASSSAGGSGGRQASTSLNYPFQILAWAEDNGAPKEPANKPTPIVVRPPNK